MARREHHIGSGDILFVMHAYGADSRDPWSIYWCCFGGADASTLLDLANVTATEPVVNVGAQVRLLSLFTALAGTLQAGYSLHHLIRAAAVVRHLLSELALLNVYQSAADTRHLDIERTIRHMLEHLSEPCSLDDLATQTHHSVSHFSHQFHARTATSRSTI